MSHSPQPTETSISRSTLIALLALTIVAGLFIRVQVASEAIRWGYQPDHFDHVGAGATAEQQGLMKVYSVQREELPVIHGRVHQGNGWVEWNRTMATLPNHPPLNMTMRWIQAKLLRLFQGNLTANTLTARLTMQGFVILAEFLTAVAAGLVAWELAGRRAAWIAGIVCWFFPPIMMNTVFWGQMDAMFLAPATFSVWFMLRRRWYAAGVSLGIAALLKTQGLILAPIALYAAVVIDEPEGEEKLTPSTVIIRLIMLGVTAAITVAVISLPWTIADGLAWVKRCYYYSFKEAFPYTTLWAFNVWYADALIHDGQLQFTLDSQQVVGNLTRDDWGRLMLIATTIAVAVLCWKRFGRDRRGVVLFAALWLWGVFMWPTRVHERYFIYCVPLVIVMAVCLRRYWPAVVGLLILGIAEQSFNVWAEGPQASWFPDRRAVNNYYNNVMAQYANRPLGPRPTYQAVEQAYIEHLRPQIPAIMKLRAKSRPWEIALTILSLLSYAWMIGASFWPAPALPRNACTGRDP